jgi:hypothetical protein
VFVTGVVLLVSSLSSLVILLPSNSVLLVETIVLDVTTFVTGIVSLVSSSSSMIISLPSNCVLLVETIVLVLGLDVTEFVA